MGLINTTTTPIAISPVPINLTMLLLCQRLLLPSGGDKKIGKVNENLVKRKNPLKSSWLRGFLWQGACLEASSLASSSERQDECDRQSTPLPKSL
jgi:hypothetical protein